MIELRSVMPNSVTNPTIEPSVSTPPVANTASTPPTSANGMLASTSSTLRQLPVTTASSMMMPSPATTEFMSRLRRASA